MQENLIQRLLEEIDGELRTLQTARQTLESLLAKQKTTKSKRKLSAAGRRRISLAQKAWWAKLRKASR